MATSVLLSRHVGPSAGTATISARNLAHKQRWVAAGLYAAAPVERDGRARYTRLGIERPARIIITDDKGDGDPDNDDVAVVTGRLSKLRFEFDRKEGQTVYYRDAAGSTARLTKDTAADQFTLTSACQTVLTFHGLNTAGVAAGRLDRLSGIPRRDMRQRLSRITHALGCLLPPVSLS